MSGKRYYAETVEAQAVTAEIDLFEILPDADHPIEIVSIHIGQTSDLGDAEEEALTVKIIRGNTTSGSGGSAGSGIAIHGNANGDGATVEIANTTVASGGTPLTVHAGVWNIRGEYLYMPPPDARPTCNESALRMVVRLSAPADSITVTATLVYAELN